MIESCKYLKVGKIHILTKLYKDLHYVSSIGMYTKAKKKYIEGEETVIIQNDNVEDP